MSYAPRSTFVSTVGGVFTALSALYLLIAIMQNVMLAFMPPPPLPQAGDSIFPPAAVWIFQHFRELVVANLVLSVVSLAASIGLLLRHEWARITFVALMAVGIAWNIAAVVLEFQLFGSIRAQALGADAPAGIGVFFVVMQVIMTLFCAGFCWLFGWIAWRLLQPDIRQEFAAS